MKNGLLLVMLSLGVISILDAQTGVVKFDVVSIRPCAPQPPAGGRGIAPGDAQYSPEYVHWDCATLADLIEQAYAGPDAPLLNMLARQREDSPKRIRGGPSWLETDRFTIEARVSGDTNKPGMRRAEYYTYMRPAVIPALRALLADRFQLKLRRATEQRSMYALVVAAGGLNKTTLTPTAPDECWSWTRGTPRNPPAGFENKPMCGNQSSGGRRGGAGPPVPGMVRAFYTGKTMASFAESLASTMDRYVIDKTGVEGMFNFRLEYVEDDSTPPYYSPNDPYAARERAEREARKNDPPGGPNIFKALEGLGLKLEKTTGPAEYFQIDSVQRPKPNEPAFAVPAPVGQAGR